MCVCVSFGFSVGVLVQTGALLDVAALEESGPGGGGSAGFGFPGAAASTHDEAGLAVCACRGRRVEGAGV